MKKAILVLLLAVAVTPLASAGVIDVLFAGGTWSWSGAPASVLTASSTSTQINGNLIGLPISISSGAFIGGNGGLFTPYTWGAGGSIVLGGCGGPCFSGTFTNLQAGFNGTGGMTFVGNFISGTVDPLLLAYLGLPTNVTAFSGLIHFDISPTPGPHAHEGTLGSGDLHIDTVPEPGTLAMFGSGLVGLAGVLRRRLSL